MRLLLLVGTGSFIGGICRYLISTIVQSRSQSGFPYGTLLVNLTGCFVIGLLFGMIEKTPLSTEWRLFLITGILGGFTTFSAFSGETYHLIKSGYTGMALLYVALSVVVGLLLTFCGVWLFKTAIPS
jgi:fluoride exporter